MLPKAKLIYDCFSPGPLLFSELLSKLCMRYRHHYIFALRFLTPHIHTNNRHRCSHSYRSGTRARSRFETKLFQILFADCTHCGVTISNLLVAKASLWRMTKVNKHTTQRECVIRASDNHLQVDMMRDL